MKAVSIGKRTGSLVLAVTLAALASVALISYVHGLEKRAYAGVETVDVYVAHDTIPAGMTAEEAASHALLEKTTVPRKVLAQGAVTSLEALRGRVALVTILKGEQIVDARWVSPTDSGSGLQIPANHQAMSVEVDVPPGVAGFVQPGSRVSILAKLNVPSGGTTVPIARFLAQDVSVLAVGRRVAVARDSGSRAAAKDDNATSETVLLTLAVTPTQAERLTFAVLEGDLYFTLLPPGQKPVTTGGRSAKNIFR